MIYIMVVMKSQLTVLQFTWSWSRFIFKGSEPEPPKIGGLCNTCYFNYILEQQPDPQPGKFWPGSGVGAKAKLVGSATMLFRNKVPLRTTLSVSQSVRPYVRTPLNNFKTSRNFAILFSDSCLMTKKHLISHVYPEVKLKGQGQIFLTF